MTVNYSNMKQQLADLKAENETLKKFIRPETLKLLKLKEIIEVEKNIKKSIYLKYIYIPLIIILIIFIGAFSFLFFRIDFETEPLIEDTALTDPEFISDTSPGEYNIYGNTSGNIINNGLFTTQASVIYFSDGNSIYKTKDLAINPFEIINSSDSNFINLNIVGNWIYYIDMNTGYICKVRTDGNRTYGKNKAILLEEPAKQIMVYKNFIYFINQQNQIQRILTNGEKQRNVFKDISVLSFYIDNNIIYYVGILSDRKAIFAHNLKINSDYSISAADNEKIIFHGGFIYFLENDYLYKIRPDGTSKQIIITDASDKFNIIGDKIFYISNENKNLVRADTDGTDKSIIPSLLLETENIDAINIYNIGNNIMAMKTNTGIYYTNIDNIEFHTLSEVG